MGDMAELTRDYGENMNRNEDAFTGEDLIKVIREELRSKYAEGQITDSIIVAELSRIEFIELPNFYFR